MPSATLDLTEQKYYFTVMGEEVKQDGGEKKLSLKEFLDDYQRTIAVMGVFIALGLIWKNLSPKGAVPYVSYICFLISVPVLLEVWKGYKHEKASLNLTIFINLLTGIFFTSIYHLVVDYPNYFEKILTGMVWLGSFLLMTFMVNEIAHHYTQKRYQKAVDSRDDIVANYTDAETIKAKMVELNTKSDKSYSFIQAMQLFGLLFVILICIIFSNFMNPIIHAALDVGYDRKEELNLPPVESNSNSSNQ